MQIEYAWRDLGELTVDGLVIFVPQFEKLTDKFLKDLDRDTGGAINNLVSSGEFVGKAGQVVSVTAPSEFHATRLILLGLGEKKKNNADSYRRAAGTVSGCKALTYCKSAAFYLLRTDKGEYYQAAIEGYMLGSYKLLDFKTGDDAKSKNKLENITFWASSHPVSRKIAKFVERGRIIAEGQNLARTLSATPANFLTPTMLAEKAQQLAREYKLKCRVLDEKAIEREKMGALLSVSRGSVAPPKFIIMEYNGGRAGQKPVVLVGKGVTFDSGGISLKPGLNMHEMKGDMAGSAVVLTSIVTAARLKVPVNIVALIPSVENMPSGIATKPGDVVTSRKGLTIEVINTDAEGRMILADALDYANKFEPQAVIDIATLTGAALFILGYAGAPIMGNNQGLLKQVSAASDRTAERSWAMPIWDDFRDQMKSSVADLHNSGGRPAGTIAAGAFLENFIGDWPWVHIDIAYVDVEPKGRPYTPKGQTGVGVRLLVDLLANWKKM